MQRPVEQLADMLVEVISPTFVTLVVGSLVCYLVEVLYQGEYNGRLQFILCLFVMGTVCIARISLEEGSTYASFFAAPLALVTALAMFRFVEFGGILGPLGPMISLGLMAFIWWCSHQLTVDSTVVDRSHDSSGSGLLDQLGWSSFAEQNSDENAAQTETAKQSHVPSLEAVSVREDESAAATPQAWWETLWQREDRPHAHGMWAFYFALAAVPIFGGGQFFLKMDDFAERRWVFKLLVIYVASALALMLSTSFLGLRRYLKKRKLDLPLDMATGWLSIGGVMIGLLLLGAFVLPRPSPEYSVAQWIPPIQAPEQSSSPVAVGNEGVQDRPEGTAGKGKLNDTNQTNDASDSQSSSGSGSSETGNRSSGEKETSGSSGNSPDGSSSNSSGGESSSGGSSNNSNGKSDGSGERNSNAGGSEDDKGENGANGSGSDNRRSEEKGSQDNAESTNQSDTPDSGSSPSGSVPTGNRQVDESNQQDLTNPNERASGKRSQDARKNTKPPTNNQQSTSSPPAQTSSSWTSSLNWLLAGLGDILNWLGMLLMLLVAVFIAWKYGSEFSTAVKRLYEQWLAFWERFFGGRRESAVSETTSAAALSPPPPPAFGSFVDPFASGEAQQWSMLKLVQHSFAALEAWGREQSCSRREDQTPTEFAQELASQHAAVATEVQQLAQLYGQIAYGPGTTPQSAQSVLRRFWQRIRCEEPT